MFIFKTCVDFTEKIIKKYGITSIFTITLEKNIFSHNLIIFQIKIIKLRVLLNKK